MKILEFISIFPPPRAQLGNIISISAKVLSHGDIRCVCQEVIYRQGTNRNTESNLK